MVNVMTNYLTVTELIEGTTILSIRVFPNTSEGMEQVNTLVNQLRQENDNLEGDENNTPLYRLFVTPDGEYSVHVRLSDNS